MDAAGPQCRVAVLPVASVENHGVLPLETDFMIAKCVLRRLSLEAGWVRLLPVIPYSTCPEHERPSICVRPQVFIEYLAEVAEAALSTADALLVAVFHGGAYHASYAAVRHVRRTRGAIVALYNFWRSAASEVKRVYGVEPQLIHADPVEASVLAACEGLGSWGKRATAEEVLRSIRWAKVEFEPWISDDFKELYPREPVPASPELGERLVSRAVKDMLHLLRLLCKRLGGREGYQAPI